MTSPAARLLTPRLPGGIAVVAVPPELRARVTGCIQGSVGWSGARPRHAQLMVAGDLVDDVLVIPERPADGWMELHLHGSEPVLQRLEEVLEVPLQSEPPSDPAAALVLGALGQAQLALGLEQRAFRPWRGWLEGVVGDGMAHAAAVLAAANSREAAARALAEPLTLVICGQQNAGKSTLMNRLLQRERVLAGPTPGLTRDPIAEPTTLAGYPYLLVDTAGEGEAVDALDVIAQARGRAARAGGAVLRVVDGHRGPGPEDQSLAGEAFILAAKSDLNAAPWPDAMPRHLAVSALDPAGAAAVRLEVGEGLRKWRGLPPAGPVGGPAPLDVGESRELMAAIEAVGRG